jgi:hypothetical protein
MKIAIDTTALMKLRLSMDAKSKQIDYATSRALNAAAWAAKQATEREIGSVFDRPTPWIARSVRYTKATKTRLESKVDFDMWGNKTAVTASKVLSAQIEGGSRKHKRHEVALQRAGILPAGMYIMPGEAAQLDAYGNMRAAQIVQIMSWFQSFGTAGYSANMRDGGKRLGKDNKRTGKKGFSYFVARKGGHLPPGIYQRYTFAAGSSIKPVMIFVGKTAYRKRLDFYNIAIRAARAEFDVTLPGFIAEAMATAK